MYDLNILPWLDREQSYNYYYHKLLDKLLDAPEERNERTNTLVKALPAQTIGYKISSKIPLINTRKMFPVTAFAELCWTLSGDINVTWLQKYTKMWDKFVNDNNEVEAAYGYRWRKMFGRDQLLQGIDALRRDKSDRQIFISAWDSARDGLGNRWTSNVPCPTCFTLNIIDDKLNLTLFLRSSDAMVGLPYDMLMYTFLMIVCTHELQDTYPNLKYGRVEAMLAHSHIYNVHYDIAKELIENAEIYQNKEREARVLGHYVIQDIDLEQSPILWRLQTVSNIIADKDTAMAMFQDILYAQFGEKQEFPKLYKPEVIL